MQQARVTGPVETGPRDAPPSAVFDDQYRIVHLSEDAGQFLQFTAGEPSMHLVHAVHPDLRLDLRTALHQAMQTMHGVEVRRVALHRPGGTSYVHLTVHPVRDVPTSRTFSLVIFAAGCVLIGMIILAAPRRPRLPQVFFLVLAVFLLANKVWSPQYVIWLVPLAVLAQPRLWSYVLWQAAEVGYFFAIWAYLVTVLAIPPVPPADGGIGTGLYFVALLARFATVALLCVLVTRDILRPQADVVRAGGEDDPAGGVLAGAPDRFVLRLRPRPAFRRAADLT